MFLLYAAEDEGAFGCEGDSFIIDPRPSEDASRIKTTVIEAPKNIHRVLLVVSGGVGQFATNWVSLDKGGGRIGCTTTHRLYLSRHQAIRRVLLIQSRPTTAPSHLD